MELWTTNIDLFKCLMFVFSGSVSGWASCSMFSEKGLLADNGRWRRRRRKTRLRPNQVSMSHCFLRLLTSLIHYFWPWSIMDEQVQCHMAPEPMLPLPSPPLPPLTPPPLPSCQKPPPPGSFSVISLGYDLHKRGAGATSRGGREITERKCGRLKWIRAVIQWEVDKKRRGKVRGNENDDDNLKPSKQDFAFILSYLVFLSLDSIYHQLTTVYSLSTQSIYNDSN